MNEDSDAGPQPGTTSSVASPAAFRARTLGPVPSLKRHVSPDWWRTLFGPLYLLTDADVVRDEAITHGEVDRVVDLLRLHQDERVLDLCCGQGRHVLELARRGFARVQGLDRSEYLIREARQTAARESLAVELQVGDCRELPYPEGAFEAVLLMGNSFGYFEDVGDDLRVLREVRRVLRDGGRVLLDLTSGSYMRAHFEPRSWEWLDEKHFACRERELTDDGHRLVSREIVTHVERGVLADQFYAERLYDEHELHALLHEAGFARIDTAGTHETASARGQDLGMMARRFMMVGHVASRAAASKSTVDWRGNGRANQPPSQPEPLRVAVVLGDPCLPDKMKCGGSFAEADIAVIEKLKAALATLDGYRFTYLSNHATLWDDLEQAKSEVDLVFNLCDEGFHNDPRKELHVPALLDVLGVPYTGAGPQSLAHCYDKSLVRGVAHEIGVPVTEGYYVDGEAPLPVEVPLPYPVIVKPNTGDSSYGITQKSVAQRPEELAEALRSVREAVGPGRALLVEEFLTGKDLTFGLIGNPGAGFMTLPITEDDYSDLPEGLPRLCGYEAKWLPDSPYWMEGKTVPADLPDETRTLIERASIQMFERLGCRDYARFDWRLGADGLPRLLEVNPNPGWCFDGHLVVQARYAGYDYAGALRLILEAAANRVATCAA